MSATFDAGVAFLAGARSRMRTAKADAEAAIAQISDEQWFTTLDEQGLDNSVAVLVKHVGGNLRSRWTDFLTRDGEKPDRHRDTEFEVENDSVPVLRERWENGWRIALSELDGLEPADLGRTIRIRGEPHTVLAAIMRQVCHNALHAGQIVMLAKHLAGEEWRTLSIPRGGSDAYRPGAAADPPPTSQA